MTGGFGLGFSYLAGKINLFSAEALHWRADRWQLSFMENKRFLSGILVAGLLAGCQTLNALVLAPMPENDSCGAAPYAGLVGQDATALERALIMRQVRVVRPGMAITMDFSPERINFDIGPPQGPADNQIEPITRIWCG